MTALAKVKEAPAVFENRMQLTESIVHDYFFTVEEGVTLDDLLRASYWAHVAKKFRPFTKLRVTTDDAKYYAELIVVTAGSNWAVVREIVYEELESTLQEVPEIQDKSQLFTVEFKGPKNLWCIIRKEDSAMIKKEIVSKEAAYSALAEYVRAIGK